MSKLKLPKDYKSELNLHDTQLAIKTVKDFFQGMLAQRLSLTRVSAPLFVDPTTGLNDNLNGYERPVTFGILEQGDKEAEVVHSLAKWKRTKLGAYGIAPGYGIYTDMNAIRTFEDLDNMHSLYVDQWDWEKVIRESDRKKPNKKCMNAFHTSHLACPSKSPSCTPKICKPNTPTSHRKSANENMPSATAPSSSSALAPHSPTENHTTDALPTTTTG